MYLLDLIVSSYITISYWIIVTSFLPSQQFVETANVALLRIIALIKLESISKTSLYDQWVSV